MHKYERRLVHGRLLRREKRFFAYVKLDDGSETVAHCPNPGRMLTCSDPGSEVWLLPRDTGLPYRLEIVVAGETIVGVNALRANAIVESALLAGELPAFAQARFVRREAVLPHNMGRADFLLETPSPPGTKPFWIEVKSVTLVRDGIAAFPDAVSERGRKHLLALTERVLAGDDAAMLYIVQRNDAKVLVPAFDIDRDYAEAFATALDAGVAMYAYRAAVTASEIRLDKALPVAISAEPISTEPEVKTQRISYC